MEQKLSNLGVYILGAQNFPFSNGKFESSTAFFRSKELIKHYFVDENGYNLEPALLEDMFDAEEDFNQIDIKLSSFVSGLKKRSIKDLVIYYVGHGTLTRNSGFILALKNSRFENFDASSISFRNLASSLLSYAKDFRIYFILDCCFSGSALGGFQSADAHTTIIEAQYQTEFAINGVAMLCSSSKDLPSLIIDSRNVTMFTEGLEAALRKGATNINFQLLNLYDLRDTADVQIKQKNPGNDVRPELHVPLQGNGDVGKKRLFPNRSYQATGITLAFDIKSRRTTIENTVLADDMKNVITLFLSYIKDFDEIGEYSIDMILIATECNAEEAHPKPSPSSVEYDIYITRRLALYRKILTIVHKLWMNKSI